MQRRRREIEQGHLFHPGQVRPAWEALPVETRTEVTRVLAQMLSAYQARHDAGSGATEEVQHD